MYFGQSLIIFFPQCCEGRYFRPFPISSDPQSVFDAVERNTDLQYSDQSHVSACVMVLMIMMIVMMIWMMEKKVCGVFISYDAFVKEKPAVCDQCELKSLYSVGKIYCKIKITISTAENERLFFFWNFCCL